MAKLIAPGVYWVGVRDLELEKFDIVVPTPGTTYNSYLIAGEKIALIDTVKREFLAEFLENIREIIDPADIDYIVTQHSEPDHSGSLSQLLSYAPKAQVLVSQVGAKFIAQQLNSDFPHQIIKDQEGLDLGGKHLRFISAPFLHWADVMFTYLEEEQVLFSCDAFARHYPDIDEDKVPMEFFETYYQAIMAPFAPHIQKAVAKLKELPLKVVAPSHGPLLTKNPRQYIDLYEEMSRPEENDPYVVVAYASAYGYTKALADAIAAELAPQIKVQLFDIERDSTPDIVQAINGSKAFLLGSPTFNQDAVEPVWNLTAHISSLLNRGKPAAAFGSYGWSGEAVEQLSQRLKGLKLDVLPGVRAQFAPTAEDLDNARGLARQVNEKISK